MNTLLIVFEFDLAEPLGRERVESFLKSNSSWARLTNDVWMIKTQTSSAFTRDMLRQIIPNSKITVFDVSGAPWATSNMSQEIVTWFKNSL